MSPEDAPIDEDRRRRFEAHRRAGGQDAIETFLPGASDAAYAGTLEELVAIDLEFRWKDWARAGDDAAAPRLADYDALLDGEAAAGVRDRLVSEEGRLRARFGRRAPSREAARLSHYVLRECVGRGAFAEVWRAFDEDLHRDVALKLARPELVGDPQVVARLVREARSAARLRHPGIVPVFEVAEANGQPYIVSEFVEGPTLAARLRERRFTFDEAASVALQLAEALDYAHACGVVHRDVKPANCLINAAGRPVLTDFGLAQLGGADAGLTRHGDVVGTPSYMSPEQARGDVRSADARSDVYSLGVVLYEMLAGRLPFERATSESLLYAVVHEEPRPPRSLDAGVPADLETVCLRAMAKEPDRRYPTARALAEDLRRYLGRLPILARPVGPWGRLRLAVRRNPALAATIAAGAAAVALVGGIGLDSVLTERGRFREERDRANAELYGALVGDATAEIRVHDSEWHERAMASLRKAAALDVPSRDARALRDLVLRCESSFVPSFRQAERWSAERGATVALAASASGDRIAAVTDTGGVWVRDPRGGRIVASVALGAAGARRLAFVAGGAFVAVGGQDGSVRLLRTDSLEPAGAPATGAGAVESLTASAQGDALAVGRESGAIDLWRVAPDGTLAAGGALPGHDGACVAISFSGDGRRLATGGLDRWVRVWDVAGRRVESSHRVSDPPRSLAFHPRRGEVVWCSWESAGWGLLSLGPPLSAKAWPGAHLAAAREVVWSGDEFVLTASADGTIRVWGLAGNAIAVARADSGPVTSAVCVPGSNRIVAAHAGGELRAWDLADPAGRQAFRTSHTARFVPGTARLATGDGAYDFDAAGRATHVDLPVPGVLAVAAAGRGLVCARSDASVIWWPGDPSEPPATGAASAPLRCLAAAPDGRRCFGGTADGDVCVIRGDGGVAVDEPRLGLGAVRALAASAGGALAVVAERGVILRGADGVTQTLAPGCSEGGAAAFGAGLLAVSGDGGRIDVYAETGGTPVRTLASHTAQVTALAFSDGGRLLVSSALDGSLRIWDTSGWTERSVPAGGPTHAAWIAIDPLGAFVARGGAGWADVVDLAALVAVAQLDVASSVGGAFRADGSELDIGVREGGVWTWTRPRIEAARAARAAEAGAGRPANPPRLPAERPLLAGGHSGQVWGVAASPDGRLVATCAHDGSVKLWDARSLAPRGDLASNGPIAWCAAFAPDSRTIAVCAGAEVVLFDVATGRETARLTAGDELAVGLAFHPREPLLVSVSNDGDVRLWDARDGRELGLVHHSADRLHDAAFSPDGATLAVASAAGAALVWRSADRLANAARPPDLSLAGGGGSVWAVTFDSGGRYVASGTDQGVVVLRDARTFESLATFRGDLRLVRSLSFDDAGRYLAAGCYNGLSVAWDLPALRALLAPMRLDW